ncbi:MAG TPA: beta-ketoacyl synthase N-terminal-like domain-containing protein [Tepidisphaeraceae bacterium]|nr:beta-ketoacyl synthase N-terminal-like domain-containing protein [Tepidisphaeraceae bacterium]
MKHLNITGTGLVTALGMSVAETWRALMAGQFIRDHAKVEVCKESQYPRVTTLAFRAANEAIASAGWQGDQVSDDATALIVGTSKGPIERWMTAVPFPPSPGTPGEGWGEGSPKPATVSTTTPPLQNYRTKNVASPTIGLHEVAESLSRELQLGFGPRLTISAACSSGLHALIHAALLLKSGQAKRALVVAAEASVHPLFIGSFKRLGVLPPEGHGCRPFDANRSGFLMSEAAAAICLEASDSASGLAQLDRFALGADATHLTGVDPSAKTLGRLLKRVIDTRQVDLIHAHGTGTQMNDPVELTAIEECIESTDGHPILYSHKGAIGHSLGASGLVSVVLNLESHRTGLIPPNIQTTAPLPTRRVRLGESSISTPIRRSLAIAAGFGGPIAVVSCISA